MHIILHSLRPKNYSKHHKKTALQLGGPLYQKIRQNYFLTFSVYTLA